MVRKVLALLLLRRGQTVTHGALCDELWEGKPPRTAAVTVRTHVYHLRGLLNRSGPDRVVTRPSGYALMVEDAELDAAMFARRVTAGEHALRGGHHQEAARTLRQALDIWKGDALAGVRTGPLLAPHAAALEESRVRALNLRIDADLRLGRHREVVGELRELVAAHPFDERLRARLMETLRLAGRRHEALTVFADACALLDRELGARPSAELRRSHQAVKGRNA
jgi:SARP family transcriptional regulator, regulator of embCAB operon